MKKLLVGTAAIALGLVVAAPAQAQLQLGVAGHFKGYVSWVNQDTTAGTEERHLDILRDTEVHFTGETTLDNGLTVGVHVEALADAGDNFGVDESYAYASGYWGRVNFGDEDGAAYLLQVAAPSADSNVDGIRQYINPVRYTTLTTLAANGPQFHGAGGTVGALDYANDYTRHADKITYLTPVFSGFQAGVSFTPDMGNVNSSRIFGTSVKNNGPDIGSVYEAAARWEGTYNNVGMNFGGGYTWGIGEGNGGGASADNFKQWNVGGDINVAAFGFGAVYSRISDILPATANDQSQKTWDVGADWTTGPFKLGASWLNNKAEAFSAGNDVKTNRYSGGVVYTFAPGMSFRGSVGIVRTDIKNTSVDVDATYGLLGTQINF